MLKIPQIHNRINPALAQRLDATGASLEVRNADGEEADILIYDAIAWYAISAEAVARELSKVKAKTLNVRINSPGGDVFDGVAIHNTIRRFNGRKVIHIDGIAASAASFIAMAGDEVIMHQGSFMMIHNAEAIVMGDHRTMREVADVVDKITGSIAGLYARRTEKDADEIRLLMDAETWFTDQEAVEFGLADRIDEDTPAVTNDFDLTAFRNLPDQVKSLMSPRAREKALRDAGLSRGEAKKSVAEHRDAEQRDAAAAMVEMFRNGVMSILEARKL